MVRSFGQPEEPELEEDPVRIELPPAGTIRISVDLVATPESLALLEQQLTNTIAQAVVAGFAQAAAASAN
jgi:hypothetical protein